MRTILALVIAAALLVVVAACGSSSPANVVSCLDNPDDGHIADMNGDGRLDFGLGGHYCLGAPLARVAA